MTHKRLLRTSEAAKYLGVSTSMIIRWCNQGILPHSRLPTAKRDRRFDPKDLDAFLTSSNTQTPPPDDNTNSDVDAILDSLLV